MNQNISVNNTVIMKLLYLHGLASGGQSATARLLSKLLPELEVIAPDIPVNGHEAMSLLAEIGRTLSPDDIIVGTSMGAFYALMMHGWRRILVNPSFHTSQAILRPNFGKTMPFFLPRRDGVQQYTVTEELCRSVEEIEARRFESGFGISNGTPDSDDKVMAFFGLRDTLVDCRDEYLMHHTRCGFFDGPHRLDPATMTKVIIPEIRNMIASTE